MTGEEDQPISEKQGYPRNEEFNPRKGEDNYQLQFANNKIQFDAAMANAQAVTSIGALALQGAVTLQQELNKLSLSWMDAREKAQNQSIAMRSGISESEQTQRLEHEDEHDLFYRNKQKD